MLSTIKPLFLLILTEQCFEEYFYNFNFFEANCFKSTLSKVLGFGMIAGSMLVRVPQILKIYRGKSGAGLSISGILLELTAITIQCSYSFVHSFPFSAWGDGFMLGIQTVIVIYLVLLYAGKAKEAYLFLVSYLIIVLAVCNIVPIKVLWILQACNVPIVLSGKLIQAWVNYKNGSTGQLAAATVFALTIGSMARIFTSIQETGDPMMVIIYLSATLANSVLCFQMFYYWNVDDLANKQKLADKVESKKKK